MTNNTESYRNKSDHSWMINNEPGKERKAIKINNIQFYVRQEYIIFIKSNKDEKKFNCAKLEDGTKIILEDKTIDDFLKGNYKLKEINIPSFKDLYYRLVKK